MSLWNTSLLLLDYLFRSTLLTKTVIKPNRTESTPNMGKIDITGFAREMYSWTRYGMVLRVIPYLKMHIFIHITLISHKDCRKQCTYSTSLTVWLRLMQGTHVIWFRQQRTFATAPTNHTDNEFALWMLYALLYAKCRYKVFTSINVQKRESFTD